MQIRNLMATVPTIATLTLGACAGDDPMVFVGYNAYADPQQQCTINSKLVVGYGRLDVADTIPPAGTPNPRQYDAYFVLVTNMDANDNNAEDGENGYEYFGHVSTNEVLIEEMELSYDFSVSATPPSGATLDVIPQRMIVPASAWVGPDTKAGLQGADGTSFLNTKLVGSAIADTLNADPDLYSLLEPPSSYSFAARFLLRGRTTGGHRIETEEFVYPIDICRGCLVNNTLCSMTCYPPYQDCR